MSLPNCICTIGVCSIQCDACREATREGHKAYIKSAEEATLEDGKNKAKELIKHLHNYAPMNKEMEKFMEDFEGDIKQIFRLE